MATRDKRRFQRDPSETQLRVMLEARQHELEAHRQRTSRTFSMLLLGAVFLIAGAIWLTPVAPAVSDYAAARPAAVVISGAAANDSAEDVRFALQLLNFANPTASAKPLTTPEAVTTTVTEASVAMP